MYECVARQECADHDAHSRSTYFFVFNRHYVLYMCPHAALYVRHQYVAHVSYCYMRVLNSCYICMTSIYFFSVRSQRILVYMCPHTAISVFSAHTYRYLAHSYCYVYLRIHTAIHMCRSADILLYFCVLIAYCYACVLILLYMCFQRIHIAIYRATPRRYTRFAKHSLHSFPLTFFLFFFLFFSQRVHVAVGEL